MNRPPEQQPPPYGALIEAAREDAGLSRREAARRAGISDAWWRYVASGWQNGPVTGTAETVAAMALATGGVTPEQMETKGERPDAARVMRRLLRDEPGPPASATPPRLSLAPSLPPAGRLAEWLTSLPDEDIARVVAHDPLLRQVWDLPGPDGGPADRGLRIELLVVILTRTGPAAAERRANDAGLPIP
jgi:transcriptional regulator with XRE-family HTH domain